MMETMGTVSIATGEESLPCGLPTPRRHSAGATRKRRTKARTETVSSTGEEPMAELEGSQVQRLLEEFVPETEEPLSLRDENLGISPVALRLRARSAHPQVTSVPADTHSSLLQPGGKTALLTPCQEIVLARRIEHG